MRTLTQAALASVGALAMVTGLCVAATPVVAAELPAPVLQYTFDELTEADAGTTIADAGAGGRDATIAGAGATVVAGPTGAADDLALRLPGGSSSSGAAHAVLPGLASAFAGKADATMSFWTMWDGGSACQWAATIGTSVTRHLFLTPVCGSNFIGAVNVSGENRAARGGALTTAEWSHVTLVLRGGASLTLYLDGIQVAQSTSVAATRTAANVFDNAAATVGGYLGRSFYTADPYYDGALDDVRVYDSALDADEVLALGDTVYQSWVQAAADAIDLGDTLGRTSNLSLPVTGANETTIAWATSDASVISASGEIFPPAEGESSATLTATVSRGELSVTRDFSVTVAALDPDDAVASAADRLALPSVVESGYELPTEVSFGTTISWSTDSAGASVTGSVLEAGTGSVSLTATVSHPEATATQTKQLEVEVLASADAGDLLGYTRTPTSDPNVYNSNLANSLHLGVGTGGVVEPLNENYGIVFPSAVASTQYTNQSSLRTIVDPAMFRLEDGGYGILAVRALGDGTPDDSAATSLLLITTSDLRTFEEQGLVMVNPAGTGVREPEVLYDSSDGEYLVFWRTASGSPSYTSIGDLGDPATVGEVHSGAPIVSEVFPEIDAEGAQPETALTIPVADVTVLENRFGRIHNTASSVADQEITAGDELDLSDVRADLTYSDGSTATRAVDWDAESLAAVDTATPGTYEVTGTVRQQQYSSPFIEEGADPTIFRYGDSYLYIATRFESTSPGLWIRQAPTIAGLQTAEDHQILSNAGTGWISPFWAPELHIIGGKLTILFAGNPTTGWTVQATAMQLAEGGDPTVAADWSAPAQVRSATGGELNPGISLDMTYYADEYQGQTRHYYVWSGRPGWRDAVLFIATFDPANPWRLTSDPVQISTNEFAWNKNQAPIDEGPFIIRHDDTLNLTFSGSSTGHTYVTGRMTAAAGADLLDPASWSVDVYPALKSDWSATPLELGPGHNSFSVDEDGNEIFVFHARDNLSANSPRDTSIRRLNWTVDGYPILDMTLDEEVAPENRTVTAVVTVTGSAERALEVELSVSSRCLGGKVLLIVKATNADDLPVTVALDTSYGSKTWSQLAAGTSKSIAFATRTDAIPAGQVSAQLTAEASGQTQIETVNAPYGVASCAG